MEEKTEADAAGVKILEARSHFLTTFNFEKSSDGAKINVVGCMELLPVSEITGGVRGAIYLRGDVIPVVDLRLKSGLEPIEIGGAACILLLEHESQNKKYQIGIIVSDVSDVLAIVGEEMEDQQEEADGLDKTENGRQRKSDLARILMDVDHIVRDVDFNSFQWKS